MRMRKWSPLRWMLMPQQKCLGGTNRDCEYNWVILMRGPQGLCDLKGLFCWGKPARGQLQNHEIRHCFLLHWCWQFLKFQEYILTKYSTFFFSQLLPSNGNRMMKKCKSPSGFMLSSYHNVCSDMPIAFVIFLPLPFFPTLFLLV